MASDLRQVLQAAQAGGRLLPSSVENILKVSESPETLPIDRASIAELVEAEQSVHHNVVGFYFIFLSVYASGAMASGVQSKQIDGWEWIIAVFDVTVVLTSTSIGTRCFYEAVALQRADKNRKGAAGQ